MSGDRDQEQVQARTVDDGAGARTTPTSTTKRVVDNNAANAVVQRISASADGDDTPADPVALVRSEREAGRGDSSLALNALSRIVDDINDPISFARAESHIRLGHVQRPLHLHDWAEALASLSPATRAREGYEKLIVQQGGKRSLPWCIKELRAAKDNSAALDRSVEIIRSYRAAGLASVPAVVEELVALLRVFGSCVAVEELVEGASFPNVTNDEELLTLLWQRDPGIHSAYEQARARLRLKTSTPKTQRDTKNTKNTTTSTTTTTKVLPSDRSAIDAGGGGGGAGGKMGPYALSKANFEGVADDQLNERMSSLLLQAAGADPQVALWLSRYKGPVPPPKLFGIGGEASQKLPDTYTGFAIYEANALMPGAMIRSYIDQHGYIDPTLDRAFFVANIQPLLCNETVLGAAQAENMAAVYEQQAAEIAALVGNSKDSPLIPQLEALREGGTAYRQLATRLRSGETTVDAERKLMLADNGALDRAISYTAELLAEARKTAATEDSTSTLDEYQQRERAGTVPVAGGVRPTFNAPKNETSAQKAERSLASELESLKRQQAALKLALATPGMLLPGAGAVAKTYPGDSISASTQTQGQRIASSITRGIEYVTTGDNPYPGESVSKNLNEQLIAVMHLGGRVAAFDAGVAKFLGDGASYVLPDWMSSPLLRMGSDLRDLSTALSGASSKLTGAQEYDVSTFTKAGGKIPLIDRVLSPQKIIEQPDAALFTLLAAVPSGGSIAVQAGIIGLQSLEAFFSSYGRGESVSGSLSSAGLVALQGGVGLVLQKFGLPGAVGGNIALIYVMGKIQGVPPDQIEEEIARSLLLLGLGAAVGGVTTRAKTETQIRDLRSTSDALMRSLQTTDATDPSMQKMTKDLGQTSVKETTPRKVDPALDAQIDDVANSYRRTVVELDQVTRKLKALRSGGGSQAESTALSGQLAEISLRVRAQHDQLGALFKQVNAQQPANVSVTPVGSTTGQTTPATPREAALFKLEQAEIKVADSSGETRRLAWSDAELQQMADVLDYLSPKVRETIRGLTIDKWAQIIESDGSRSNIMGTQFPSERKIAIYEDSFQPSNFVEGSSELVKQAPTNAQGVLVHEIFHEYFAQHPEARTALYQSLGVKSLTRAELQTTLDLYYTKAQAAPQAEGTIDASTRGSAFKADRIIAQLEAFRPQSFTKWKPILIDGVEYLPDMYDRSRYTAMNKGSVPGNDAMQKGSWIYGGKNPNEYEAELGRIATTSPEILYEQLVKSPERAVSEIEAKLALLKDNPNAAQEIGFLQRKLTDAKTSLMAKQQVYTLVRREIGGVDDAAITKAAKSLTDGVPAEMRSAVEQLFGGDVQAVMNLRQLETLVSSYQERLHLGYAGPEALVDAYLTTPKAIEQRMLFEPQGAIERVTREIGGLTDACDAQALRVELAEGFYARAGEGADMTAVNAARETALKQLESAHRQLDSLRVELRMRQHALAREQLFQRVMKQRWDLLRTTTPHPSLRAKIIETVRGWFER